MEELRARLLKEQDTDYARFQSKLIPTVPQERIIGVRTPKLREIAKQMQNTDLADRFLQEKEHSCFEEDQIHAFLINSTRDYKTCLEMTKEFLPRIDNWATCDQLIPKTFKKHKQELLPVLMDWLNSSNTYTIRFAISMFMRLFLDEDFKPETLDKIAALRSEEYYVNMMIAWFMATALAKQWDATLPVLAENKTDRWVHNKTIQKAIESYRITDTQKQILRTLKR